MHNRRPKYDGNLLLTLSDKSKQRPLRGAEADPRISNRGGAKTYKRDECEALLSEALI